MHWITDVKDMVRGPALIAASVLGATAVVLIVAGLIVGTRPAGRTDRRHRDAVVHHDVEARRGRRSRPAERARAAGLDPRLIATIFATWSLGQHRVRMGPSLDGLRPPWR